MTQSWSLKISQRLLLQKDVLDWRIGASCIHLLWMISAAELQIDEKKSEFNLNPGLLQKLQISPTYQYFWIPEKVVIFVLYHKCKIRLLSLLSQIVYSVYVIHTFTGLWTSAIHPFCKYAPENDRLSEQIYNKFSQLAMIDLGTESTIFDRLKFCIFVIV